MGSPQFAVPSLAAVHSEYDLVALVCQPDRPGGRGLQVVAPATKLWAAERHLHVIQPKRVKDAIQELGALEPSLLVVAAYGQILPQELLDLPEHGSVNVHASLLPRWRGAAPVQAAILHGDSRTGVSIMLMDAGMDTGPILGQREVEIGSDETGGELSARLAELGAVALVELLPGYLAGSISPSPQDDSLATAAPRLKKQDGALDISRSAIQLERQVRAYDPWPGTYLTWRGSRLAVKRARALQDHSLEAGTVSIIEGGPAVGTGEGALLLMQVQLEGKRAQSGAEFVRGARGFVGSMLGTPQ